jgi:hypothetical protein
VSSMLTESIRCDPTGSDRGHETNCAEVETEPFDCRPRATSSFWVSVATWDWVTETDSSSRTGFDNDSVVPDSGAARTGGSEESLAKQDLTTSSGTLSRRWKLVMCRSFASSPALSIHVRSHSAFQPSRRPVVVSVT